MAPNAKGALFALLAFALFSTHDAVVKTLGEFYSPIQILFFAVLFSFPLTTLMLMRDAKADTLFPHHPGWMAARTVAVVVTGTSAFYAFSVLPLAQTYAIIFAAPLFITILSIPILGEAVRLRRWVAVLVGLAGVMVVLRPGSEPLTLGHGAALMAAMGGAVASIIVRKIGREERPVVMLLYPLVANFVLLGAALALVYEPMPIEHLGLVAVVAALSWLAGLFVIAAYSNGEAVIVAPMQYSQIIWAAIFGSLFFRESIDQFTLMGAGIIIASGIYIVLRESRVGGEQPVLRTRSRPETGQSPRISSYLRRRREEADAAESS